jgi:hypothetical protein
MGSFQFASIRITRESDEIGTDAGAEVSIVPFYTQFPATFPDAAGSLITEAVAR